MLIKKGDRVTLTELEQRIALTMARIRQFSNVDAGVPQRPFTDRDGVTTNLIGAGGELAFARLTNVYPDFTTHLRSGGGDCQLHSGDFVDVKATPYVDRPLLVVSITKRPDAVELYALMACDFPHYEFVGWAPADRVLRSIKDIGYGPSHVLEPKELEEFLGTGDVPGREFFV